MTATTRVVDRIPVIDVDTHIAEPPDLWTARVAKKWGSRVPHVVADPNGPRADGKTNDVWVFGDARAIPTAAISHTGTPYRYPLHPATLEEGHPGAYAVDARVRYMDSVGIQAQVLYPNTAGFGSGGFLALEEPELMRACVRAYNDFQLEWVSAAPGRFIPIAALPFWEVPAAVAEIDRCAALGHKGVLFSGEPHTYGEPPLEDAHWDPIWHAAQDAGLSINFHIASGARRDVGLVPETGWVPDNGIHTNVALAAVLAALDNARAIGHTIMGGLCHRFPRLSFVSVESGVGWLPTYLAALDWQWQNLGGADEHPERDLLPSEYFRRQVYGTFWYETDTALRGLEHYPNNFMFETDFPHPTSLTAGPASAAPEAGDWIEEQLSGWPEELLQHALHDNAARLYKLD